LTNLYFPRPYLGLQDPSKLTSADWKNTIKLSSFWGMKKIRDIAIQHLNNTYVSPIEQYILGRDYASPVLQGSGFLRLASQSAPLRNEEGYALGLHDALQIFRARELCFKPYRSQLRQKFQPLTPAPVPQDFTPINLLSEFDNILGQPQAPDIDEVEAIRLALAAGVHTWIKSAYTALIQREELVTDDEALRLGITDTLKICRAREADFMNCKGELLTRNCLLEPEDYRKAVRTVSGLDLEGCLWPFWPSGGKKKKPAK
jgi:hypothetical protein